MGMGGVIGPQGGGDQGCPEGTTYDPVTGLCLDDTGFPVGFPISIGISGPGTGVTQTPTSGGPSTQETDLINVVNNFTANNNIDTGPIGQAISDGIGNVVNSVDQVATNVAQTISGSISQLSNSLLGWIENIGRWIANHIADILKAIGSALKDIASTVITAVENAVTGALKALSDNVIPILQGIANALKTVTDFYQRFIQPILQTVAGVVTTIQAAIVAIQRDINSGLQGILQLPTDLANAFTNLDAYLQRAVNTLKANNLDVWSQVGGYSSSHQLTSDFANLHTAIQSIAGVVKGAIPTFGSVTLPEPSLQSSFTQLIETSQKIAVEVFKGAWEMIKDPSNTGTTLFAVGEGIVLSAFGPLAVLALFVGMLKAPLDEVSELAGQIVRQAVPISKLDVATVIEAWHRGILDANALNAELKVQGWDAARQRVFQDLAEYFPTVAESLDKFHRGIITEDDLDTLIAQHGLTPQEGAAQKEQSFKVPSIGTFVEALQFENVQRSDLDEIFRDNRFTDAEREATLQNAFRPTGHTEEHSAFIREALIHAFGFDTSQFDNPPPYWTSGAAHEGISADAAKRLWQGTWNFLDIGTWINLYFRGFVSATQVGDIMSSLHIPAELYSSLIDASRPLIPFRTIPALVRAGIITDAVALQKLQQHGYTLEDATTLLKYATAASKATKATTAATQHQVSLATAKSLFDDGAITQAQYEEILKEHGFDQTTIALDVQLATIQSQAAARKAIGTDIVNEFQAGLIDETQALQQLSQSGLTGPEQAKYAKSLRSTRASKAKLPTEAELRAMAKKGVITVADYTTNLSTIGYSQFWAQAFTDLYFPADSVASQTSGTGG